MKKAYFIARGKFDNEYSLYYTETPEEEKQAEIDGCERITRKEAIAYCVAERRRRKNDPAFAYYANTHVWPYAKRDNFMYNDQHRDDSGYIIEERYMEVFREEGRRSKE